MERPLKIALCVPFPNGGHDLFQLLVESAARLASGKHEISLEFTCHDEAQRQSVLGSDLALGVGRSHIVVREPSRYFHANSVTHSRCVNALFAAVDADLAVICDFDMAFAFRYWDEFLLDLILNNNVAFFGTPYSSDAGFTFKLPRGPVSALKYQGKPNCMFIAFEPHKLKSVTDQLCDFATRFGDPRSIPLQFISNEAESRCFGLPIGSFLHVDTGSLVPRLIEQHGFRHLTMERRVKTYTVLKSARFPQGFSPILLPEEYSYEGVPFIAHFRKGASKPTDDNYPFALFKSDVRTWNEAVADAA